VTPQLLSQLPAAGRAANPQGNAFRFQTQELTHEALCTRAAGLGEVLQASGVDVGATVGLLLNKSIHMPIAVYGVLGAGGVYVPLDTRAPVQRLAYILSNADIEHLVVGDDQLATLAKLLEAGVALKCVYVSDEKGEVHFDALEANGIQVVTGCFDRVSEQSPVDLDPESPAYILYTSGTTGTPKGILHSHRSGMAYARLSSSLYGLHRDDVMGNFSPLHFDMATFELFGGPLVGASVILIPPSFGFAIASLAQLIEAEGMTVWYSVPYVLAKLESSGVLEGRDLSRLRWVNFAGEAYPVAALARLMPWFPNARFSNVYGPTETNQCTYLHIDDPLDMDRSLPIGRGWGETDLLIVDEQEREVPQGEEGELLVSSSTTMLGYWQRPDLDDLAFMHAKGRRYYRTGDIVVASADGQLRIVGRKDRQVKIHGYRIELDEIEHLLSSHPSVIEAAVFCVQRDNAAMSETELMIEAAVAVKTEVSTKVLSRHIAQKLPSYAVPNRIHVLTALPRTATDKVDRQALVRDYSSA